MQNLSGYCDCDSTVRFWIVIIFQLLNVRLLHRAILHDTLLICFVYCANQSAFDVVCFSIFQVKLQSWQSCRQVYRTCYVLSWLLIHAIWFLVTREPVFDGDSWYKLCKMHYGDGNRGMRFFGKVRQFAAWGVIYGIAGNKKAALMSGLTRLVCLSRFHHG